MVGWLFFAISAAITLGVARILFRYVAKDAPIAGFLIGLHFFGLLFALPLFLLDVNIPSEPRAWLFLVGSVLAWSVGMLFTAFSLKRTHASIREPIAQTQLLWSMLFAFIILKEVFTYSRIIGALCITVGAVLVSLAHIQRDSSLLYGITMTAIMACLYAIAGIIDKGALAYFTPSVYNFLLYAGILVVLISCSIHRRKETWVFLRAQWPIMALCGFLNSINYVLTLSAYAVADLSIATPIIQSGSVIAIVGAMMLFPEERTHMGRKVIAALLIVIGALFVATTA